MFFRQNMKIVPKLSFVRSTVRLSGRFWLFPTIKQTHIIRRETTLWFGYYNFAVKEEVLHWHPQNLLYILSNDSYFLLANRQEH